MVEALERCFPEGTTWSDPEGGYFLWVDLPAGVDAASLLERAAAEDVTFVRGSDFFLEEGGAESMRLAFSFATADEIPVGIERLGALVRDASAVAA
jgi:2-aminoadipate transaminase